MTFSGTDCTSSRTAALLEQAEANVIRARRADAERLVIAHDWALGHRKQMFDHDVDTKRLGAVSIPVWEYAPAELAVALRIHPTAARKLMSDAVDMTNRLPRVWGAVQALELEAWVGRKIVALTSELNDEAAAQVDGSICDVLGTLPTSRLLDLVAARVVEVDQELADRKAEESRRRRFVGLGRKNEHGVRGFVARMDSLDATRLFAMVDFLAQHLAESEGSDDVETIDVLRARALGMLADPAGVLAFLKGDNPTRAKSVVHVHTTPDFWQGGSGVARVVTGDSSFAATRDMITRLLGRDHITVKPVIDLADQVSSDRYEIPTDITDRISMIKQADIFPYAGSTSRAMDQDHTIPWPRGSTSVDNLGFMTRTHHRIKTHAPGWTVRQLPDHRFLWRTPHGRYLITDHAGTHRVTEAAPPQSASRLETYLSDLVLDAA